MYICICRSKLHLSLRSILAAGKSSCFDELKNSIDSNPEKIYEILLKSIKDVKDKCLSEKNVKCNKKKHKTSEWMTSALLE